MGGPSYYHVRKDLHLRLTMGGTNLATMSERLLHLHLSMGGTNLATRSERLSDSSLLLRRNLDLENTKLLP